MRRLLFYFAFLLTSPALAQFTTVTASVPQIPNATYTFDFVFQSSQPGPPLLGGISVFPTQINGNFDSFGRLSASVATNNQVLPLPSQWQLNIGITPCVGVHQGFNIVFTATSGTQDISTLIATALPPAPPACNGGGGGGAGNPAPPPFSIQFNDNNQKFGGSIGATEDLLGNIAVLSVDGLKEAFKNQTTPSSNNGIQNALAQVGPDVLGNKVVAGPDYAQVEGIFSGNSVCQPGFTNWRDAIGCPAPFANDSLLIDYRTLGFGSYAYNTNMGPLGGFFKSDRWVSNQQPLITGNGVFGSPQLYDWELSGAGKNGFLQGLPDSWTPVQKNFEIMRRGIMSMDRVECQCESLGDTQLINNTINVLRGSNDASGEGFQTERNDIGQHTDPFWMTVDTDTPAGSTQISGVQGGPVPFIADGTYIVKTNNPSPQFHIVSKTDPGANGCIPGTWTVDATLTTDNIGCSTSTVTTPSQYDGLTTNETFTVSGLSHEVCFGNTLWNGSACVANGSIPATGCLAWGPADESARIISAGTFSGGTQTITAALRFSYGPNFSFSQGPHACNFVEAIANQGPGSPPGRQLFRIIGVLSSHVYLYARTVFGLWHPAPTGLFSTITVAAPGATLTRNGSNQVSVTVSDASHLLDNVFIIVPAGSCTDHSFEGPFATTGNTGTTLTWTNAGAAASTTCSATIEVQSRLNGNSVRAAQEYPGAEITFTNDQTTFAMDGHITVEPNINFDLGVGDIVEDHAYHDVVMQFEHNLMNFLVQNAPIGQPLHAEQISGPIPEGMIWQALAFSDPASSYEGLGGTKKIGNVLFSLGNSVTPWAVMWANMPSPRDAIYQITSCLYACSDVRSFFDLISIPADNGFYRHTFHEDTGLMDTFTTNSTSTIDVKTSPIGGMVVDSFGPTTLAELVLQPGEAKTTSGGGGGTNSVFDMFPDHVTTTVTGIGPVSHVTQTPVQTTSDVPAQFPVFTVGGLPAASTFTPGSQVVVSDATTFTPGTCTGGGSDFMIAVSNGSTWSCH